MVLAPEVCRSILAIRPRACPWAWMKQDYFLKAHVCGSFFCSLWHKESLLRGYRDESVQPKPLQLFRLGPFLVKPRPPRLDLPRHLPADAGIRVGYGNQPGLARFDRAASGFAHAT